jgi:glutamate-1-semialdehyde 2,1-aminomutase
MNDSNTYHTSNSHDLFDRAKKSIPGGVNSPVRAFKSVGGEPVFMKKAMGAYMYDADDNRYIDFINSWGPMILGHSHPEVIQAIRAQATKALSFGAPTELEIEMAELIISMVPNVDMIRLVSSGTEACMSALRLARGYTGRNKFIKFEGCYHGHADPFLVKAGSGVATFNIQTVPGVTAKSAEDTLTAEFNNLDQVRELFKSHPEEIAAIIVEPVAGNMGCVLPSPGFLEGLRSLCDHHRSVLIFDEVMTGFRLAPGGAQEKLGVDADLITYGKVIGGGMPVGAFGGKREIMEHIAPLGNVYQAGTLSGNPLAVTAGITTLTYLKENPWIYSKLDHRSYELGAGLKDIMNKKGIPHTVNRMGSMISLFFGAHAVHNLKDAASTDISMFNRFFHHMLKHGVYLPPSAYESWFLTIALNDKDIEYTFEVASSF